MKKVMISDLKPYAAAKHFNMTALKVHERESDDTPKYWIGMSHFLPAGGTEYTETPVELVYFLLEGEIVIKSKNEKFVLKKWDSIHMMPGESKELINETNLPATILVIA